jgi:hypothetical protein
MNPNESPPPAWYRRLPPLQAKLLGIGFSLVAGFVAAVVIHYVLYRIGLPSKPFIYVAF